MPCLYLLSMYPKLQTYIKDLGKELSEIPGKRRDDLEQIAGFVKDKLDKDNSAKLNFICTHNSRRSHLCRIWAAVLAKHFGLDGIETYSGGTEATAFNLRAIAAIERAGFRVEHPGGKNPHYKVYYDEEKEPLVCFSKTFDDPYNPQQHFAAIITCSDADANCPFVPGAEKRFSIPYVDPKEADGTPQEAKIYDERCRQIAAEMYLLISKSKE